MATVIDLALLCLGFFMLVKGADWFVEGAAGIAEKFGIPHLVIGLTIVAMGTSMPEAAVSIAAALKGSADITIGNVLGSNILNVFMILGLTSVVTNVAVGMSTIRYEIPFVIIITAVLMILGNTGGEIAFPEGISLWVFFIGYLIYLFKLAKDKKEVEAEEEQEHAPVWKLLVGIVVGIVCIVWGSDISVEAASDIARLFGLSERLIGLTIVAFGTSLPELVTSVAAAKKGNADIAIGNIVGSNIFNILFVVGTTALVTPVAFASNFMIDSVVSIVSCALLWLFVSKKKHLNRKDGIIFLLGYAVYFVYLLIA